MKTTAVSLTIENERSLPSLFGDLDKNLRLIENTYGVILNARGNRIQIEGDEKSVTKVERLIRQLADMLAQGVITPERRCEHGHPCLFRQSLRCLEGHFSENDPGLEQEAACCAEERDPAKVRRGDQGSTISCSASVRPAPAKTYLAMATAVSALLRREVSRIILVRPAVEAGEKLGFLPGDLYEKINPYLRPLYDALYDMIETEKANKLVERGDIEIAPLAFMRGRTLNDSFIILDEAQNTTSEQMKMFLTRLGFNSKTVITGDITQIDLPSGRNSGLIEVQKILEGIEGIRFVYFTNKDVVRHKLVQQIIKAYEQYEGHE